MTSTVDPVTLRHAFVDHLVEKGAITDPAWEAAFRAVPRHEFVTRFTAMGPRHTVHDLSDPEQQRAALEAVYSDTVLLTQYDANGTATSSSTECTLMAIMLHALAAHPGHRVLEIGLGTGYNAALLCHRFGDEQVTSVDIDAELVETARASLARAGYHPAAICRDGSAGVAELAPYDRIIATCGVLRVPPAWLEQTATGGLILVNVGFGLARLTKCEDGSATGPFIGPAAFMRLRHDVDNREITTREIIAMTTADLPTRVAPMPAAARDEAAVFLLELAMPGVHRVVIHLDPDVHVFADPKSGSWVRAIPLGDGTAELVEHGDRQLWDQVCAVVDSWHAVDRPGIDRYGLTVDTDGAHTLWLADSDWSVHLD
jgi:protein-L-isoaspartate O-methyltransferase